MRLESDKLSETAWNELGWADRIRKMRLVAPVAILFYCLFVKGAILDGRAGLYYTFQRVLAELLLSLYLFEEPRAIWQKAEGRGQKAEVRSQKSEVRSQKSEVRRQKAEGRRQKAEVRSQKSEVRVSEEGEKI